MTGTDDIELLRQYATENSEAAFSALVGRHVNLVYSVALRQVANPHAAEEITQAVFIILARKAGALSRHAVLSGWLLTATRYAASAQIAATKAPEAAQSALYLLPLATRVRSLFKMDFAEAQYISELRSGPAGHFSYRRVAWEMYLELERQHPSLAAHIRVTDFTKPIDILQR